MSTSSCRPIDHARKFYGDKFWFMVHQFVRPMRYIYSGDDFFVLAYPHKTNLLFKQNLNKDVDKLDVWVIHYFAGDIKRLFEIAPFELPYVAFQRKDRWKLYETEKLKKKLGV